MMTEDQIDNALRKVDSDLAWEGDGYALGYASKYRSALWEIQRLQARIANPPNNYEGQHSRA